MDFRYVILFLHITLMISAITIAYGSTVVMRLAYGTGQVQNVRGVALAISRIGPTIPILFILGGIFGLLTAITFGFDLLSPWLLIAYVLFAIAMVQGIVLTEPSNRRLVATVASTPDGPVPPALAELFSTRRTALLIFELAVVVGLIFDMVVKPFSS